MKNPNMRGYRHVDGFFPPIRTAFDYCPVPHYLRFGDNGKLIRSGVDGIEYPDCGGSDLTRAECDSLVRGGDYVHFDPDNVNDWMQVIAGPFGSPMFNTTELPIVARDEWINGNQKLYEARLAQLNAKDPDDAIPPQFVCKSEGLFDDGQHGPYYGELRDDEFIAHHINGVELSLGRQGWRGYVRRHLEEGSMVPFDPATLELEIA